jgi:lauroyl/myristoyl acyltransferase
MASLHLHSHLYPHIAVASSSPETNEAPISNALRDQALKQGRRRDQVVHTSKKGIRLWIEMLGEKEALL